MPHPFRGIPYQGLVSPNYYILTHVVLVYFYTDSYQVSFTTPSLPFLGSGTFCLPHLVSSLPFLQESLSEPPQQFFTRSHSGLYRPDLNWTLFSSLLFVPGFLTTIENSEEFNYTLFICINPHVHYTTT